MNDFTKEELQDLHDSLYGGIHDDHPVPDHLIILQDKIQSMIDNYCEHESDGKVYELQPEYKCKNCGEFYI